MFTYDPTTDVGRVRRTIPDRDEDEAFFTDEEIASLLIDESGWRRATALALETIASDNVLVLKVIKVQELTTDGAKVSDALLKRAAQLREQAVEIEAATDGGSFDIVQQVFDDFGARELILADAIKNTA